MFRKGERNNWGILLAWSFYLSDNCSAGVVTLCIVNFFLWKKLFRKERKEALLYGLILSVIFTLISWFHPYVNDVLFLNLLAWNIGAYLPLLKKGKIDFIDSAIWLLIGFLFYLIALILLSINTWEGMDSFRVFSILAILFIPHSLIYVICELFLPEKSLQKNNFSKNMIHYK